MSDPDYMIVLDFKGTDTIKWALHQSPFMGTGWYYCAKCAERLSFNSNFCSKCGTELEWDKLEGDPFTKDPVTMKRLKDSAELSKEMIEAGRIWPPKRLSESL